MAAMNVMPKSAHQILQQVYGYDSFRSRQEEIIGGIVEGRDTLVIMPTGGGKSLCYQIPSILRPGIGIIVSPLIALMKDQVDALRQNGVRCGVINSSISAGERRSVEQQARAGELELLFVAPERLATGDFLGLLAALRIALFGIDEAHCVSMWGHDFRPDYLKISGVMERFPAAPRIALTATADAATRADIIERLNLRSARSYVDSFDRPNIQYRIEQSGGEDRHRILRFINNEFPGESGIIYTGTRKETESLADWLTERGVGALPYHAGLDGTLRTHTQERFARDEAPVVVATIAFGMGIDKPDIRYVIHAGLPKNIESYYQETGRAGRDGEPAIAWMLYAMSDVVRNRSFIEKSEADDDYKRIQLAKLQRLLGLCETVECRRKALLAYFGETLPEPCGNCDTCLNPAERWDGTIAAQKVLSAIYRTGQRFGVGYIISLLLGKADPRMETWGHTQLPTFGCGTELVEAEWRTVIMQLLTNGYIGSSMEQRAGLKITPKGIAALKGAEQVFFRRQERPSPAKKEPRRRSAAAVAVGEEYPLDGDAQALFEALRAWRRKISLAKGIPPYAVLTNRTLAHLARARPAELDELYEIDGMGERKINRYGKRILQILQGETED